MHLEDALINTQSRDFVTMIARAKATEGWLLEQILKKIKLYNWREGKNLDGDVKVTEVWETLFLKEKNGDIKKKILGLAEQILGLA